jgi:hypothetical protein
MPRYAVVEERTSAVVNTIALVDQTNLPRMVQRERPVSLDGAPAEEGAAPEYEDVPNPDYWDVPAGHLLVESETATIGQIYVDGAFVDAPPPADPEPQPQPEPVA